MTSIVETLLEVKLVEDEDFLKIKETLTRIGVASRKEKKLYQSCHILHKRGLYYIVHFKELFLLDGKESDFTDDDRARRNTIAHLLEEWGLVTVVDSAKFQDLRAPMSLIKILPHRDKADWILESKYTVGKKR
jgi:hypothetical protein